MDEREAYINKLSDRGYLRYITHIPFIENFPFKEDENILELSNNNVFLTKGAREDIWTNQTIKRINITTDQTYLEEAINNKKPENEYHLVFCFLYTDFIRYDCDILIEYIYQVLRPCGKLFISHPTQKTPTIATYKQVVKSGQYPTLTDESVIDYGLYEKIKAKLNKLSFSSVKFEDHVDKITLPDLDTFKRYLNETAFVYKKVMPTEISNEIIQMQVDYFDDYCKKHFNGEYVFQYTLHTLTAIK